MKRSIIIMAAIMLLALPLAGCVTDDSPDKTITPLLTEISNLKNLVTKNTTDIAKLKEDVAKKADSSRVDNLATSIGKPANVDTYTKTEVDAAIASAINTLKSNQSWITGNSGSGSGNLDDEIISSDGDLDLIVERAPGDEEVWVSDKIPVVWRLTVRNKSNTGTYFRITANFDTVESPVSINTVEVTPSYSQSSMLFTSSQYSSDTAINNMSFTSRSSASESRVWIPKNSDQPLYLELKVDYATVTGCRWAWDFLIRQSN